MVTDNELLNMLTETPADVWGMQGIGSIEKNGSADIVIGEMKSETKRMDAFYALNPETILVVLSKGNIRLFDETLYEQLYNQGAPLHNFYKVSINGRCKYIYGNLPKLIQSIKEYYPEVHLPVTYG
jgi:hypothetical protein